MVFKLERHVLVLSFDVSVGVTCCAYLMLLLFIDIIVQTRLRLS